jgi:D-3-phosphoglycerate dehydrogenase / 2-oxoglutarate reductase
MRILIAEPNRFSDRALAILQELGEVEKRSLSPEGLKDALKHYDVLWLRLGYRLTAEMLSADVRCRVLATPVTGLDHIDLEACSRHEITVLSLHGETEFLRGVRATAELTLGLALALLRKIPQAVRSVNDGEWNRDLFQGAELFEKQVGIVGVGRLGSIVASYFSALGAKVVGYDPYASFAGVERAGTLEELFERSDIISLHVSYTSETHHLIDDKVLSRARPGSVLINTARGGVIEPGALVRALESGRLAGAALDVLTGEPSINEHHPLVSFARRCDRLIITPHLGGNTVESFEKTEVFLAHKIARALKDTSA